MPYPTKKLGEVSDGEIKELFFIALGQLFKNDTFLLENGAHERSVAHKLAEYLQQQFPERCVDCEYNLHGMDIKLLDGLAQKPECEEDRKTDRVYPDIIVHIRNTDEVNDLIIEMKTRNGHTACDEKKLELLTGPEHPYKYQLGLLLKFNGLSEPQIVWYKNGKIEN